MMQFRVPACRLSDDMGGLFEKSLFADCVLASGNKEFQVVHYFYDFNSEIEIYFIL